MLREIPAGRGEDPSYMKVPHIESSFKVICIHDCTVFGVRQIFRIRRKMQKNAFVCVCASVCMCVLSRSSETLYGTPEEEEMYGKF